MNLKFSINTVLLTGLLLPLLSCCKKEAIKTPPTVTIAAVSNIAANTATSGGEITADGGAPVSAKGVCWSNNQNPTASDSKTSNGTGAGSFTSSISGLTPGTTYYLKAYAINEIGTAYSSQSIFITLALAPVLTTTDLSVITSTTANSGGNIINDGGAAITVRGVCWSTNQNPTIADSKTADGTAAGSFASSISGLTPGATYYVRAYATNSIGTGYGNQITATTAAVLSTLSTTSISSITYTTANSGGNITNNGGGVVTVRGVCWGTNQNPTIADSKTTDGTGSGSFTSSVAGLAPDKLYYIRSYATNSVGTSYGDALSFKTLAFPSSVPPLLTSKWTGGSYFYNMYYPDFAGNGNINGKFPANCGPTAFARILGYWGSKIRGTGKIDAMNSWNDVRFKYDLDAIDIDYTNIPVEISWASTEPEYKDVAKIFLEAGAVGLTSCMDCGTPSDNFITALKMHFNVSDGVRYAKRWEYSKEDWINLLKTELANGRPIMFAGRTTSSPKPGESGTVAGHWFNIEGYNSENKFYINYNFWYKNTKDYYDVDDFGEYSAYGVAVIGFKPK